MDDVADNAAREAPPSLGDLLARGREEQGLSRNDVAQRLYMSPSQVEALEVGEYERLPKGPFLRGFVRNYAKVVGLDPDAVLPLLAEGAPREAAPRIVVPTQNIRFDPLGQRLSGPWVRAAMTAAVVIALAFAAMYWWLYVRPEPPAQHQAQVSSPAVTVRPAASNPSMSSTAAAPVFPASNAPTSQASTAAPSGTSTPAGNSPAATGAAGETKTANTGSQALSGASNPAGANSATPAPVASKPAEAKPAPNAAPAKPAAGARRLHFRFKGESWVEVRDASGHTVFRQLNPAGSEADVDARPPLQVVVGNAHEVELEKDGKPFDLGPAIDTDVARFKVE